MVSHHPILVAQASDSCFERRRRFSSRDLRAGLSAECSKPPAQPGALALARYSILRVSTAELLRRDHFPSCAAYRPETAAAWRDVPPLSSASPLLGGD